MRSDENILRFLYFLFFIFSLFVHLPIIFWLFWKKEKNFFWYPCSTPLYNKELFLKDLAFFWTLYWNEIDERILLSFFRNSVLNCLLMGYIWLSKTPMPDSLGSREGVGRATISPPPPAGGEHPSSPHL